MNMSDRVKIIDATNFSKVRHSVADITGEIGTIVSIHPNVNGVICYVELDTFPMTLPFYETELEGFDSLKEAGLHGGAAGKNLRKTLEKTNDKMA